MRIKRTHWLALWGVVALVTLATYALWSTGKPQPQPPTAAAFPILPGAQGVWATRQYVGVDACQECHAERADSYRQTSHYLSMQMPQVAEPVGYFPATLTTHRGDISFATERRADGLFVTSLEQQNAGTKERTEQVAMIMGSGKLSHSPFYRQGDALFQMPVFFYSPLDEWMQVPGFLDVMPYWDRAIKPRCLDCHCTFVEHVEGTKNSYRYDNMILQISCERCHGRGSEHVAFHRAHRDATEAVAIVSPQSLSRERHLEICGQCHGEIGVLKRAAFSYTPGDRLDDYVYHRPNQDDSFVRSANQLQRLEMSKCFQKTETMVCTTCHNPHAFERENLALFSSRCLECHDAAKHPEAAEIGPNLSQNCIDCHMPKRDDEIVPFRIQTGERVKLIQMRDHFIKAYPDESKFVRDQWAKPGAAVAADTARTTVSHERMALAWIRHAKMLADQRNPQAAVESLRQALHYEPKDQLALVSLAHLMTSQGKYAEGENYAREALSYDAASIPAMQALALTLVKAGKHAQAIEQHRVLLELQPDSLDVANGLAWLLATSPDADCRNGQQAVELAERVCRDPAKATWSNWDTAAAAYAEAAQFDRAIECATKALAACEAVKPANAATVEKLRKRLELFRQNTPYHEPALP